MRRVTALLLTWFAAGALAQSDAPPPLEPLPEPAPPPPASASGPEEAAVRIPAPESDKVEEIREGGRVVMLKVTPAKGGRPYYLVDTTGNGNWMRRDPLDDGVRVPMWPVLTFD
jgi:Protein of unknown function (DUF2782)